MYQIFQGNFHLEGSFSSTLENVDKFCDQARPLHSALGRKDLSFAIELLLREVLNNAVLHGNKSNPEMVITCRFSLEERTVDIDVTDEGQGFEWKICLAELAKRKQIVDDDGLLPTSGYGLLLLKEYATDFSYNEKGNHISLTLCMD